MGTPPPDVPDVHRADTGKFSYDRFDIQVLLSEARRAADRLRRRLRISHQDEEDLRQDLMVGLLARLPGFDPRRGTLGAFINVVLAHRCTEIAAKAIVERRLYGESPVSLDQPVSDTENATLGESIAEEDGYGGLWQKIDRYGSIEHRLDLRKVLGALDADELSLCADLFQRAPEEISASGSASRATVYRRLRNLRLGLMTAGLAPA